MDKKKNNKKISSMNNRTIIFELVRILNRQKKKQKLFKDLINYNSLN